MPTYRFEEVKHQGTAKTASGKKRTKTFSQTLNPLNKNPDGSVRTRSDILAALRIEAVVWQRETEGQP